LQPQHQDDLDQDKVPDIYMQAWTASLARLEAATDFANVSSISSHTFPLVIPALRYGCAIMAWPAADPSLCRLEVVAIDQSRFQANAESIFFCTSQSLSRLPVADVECDKLVSIVASAQKLLTTAEIKHQEAKSDGAASEHKHHHTAGFLHGALRSAMLEQGNIAITGTSTAYLNHTLF
jgi:hypothetical protein